MVAASLRETSGLQQVWSGYPSMGQPMANETSHSGVPLPSRVLSVSSPKFPEQSFPRSCSLSAKLSGKGWISWEVAYLVTFSLEVG